MPRSSRSKSHKQSKHSSKEAAASTARECSGSDEDVKMKERSSNGGKEDGVSFRISKDTSVSGERRKHGKDLFSSHGNGDASEEYTTSSKRREEKSYGGSDRWNGGSSEDKVVVVNVENKELLKSKDSSKVVSESKSKGSRRHDAESASVVVLEKDEGKSGSGNRGEKRKSEKESARKESSQYKESKESKDKERGSDRGRKDKLEAEASSKQIENQSSKRGKESTDWPIEEGLRNPELEKELEKRMRRRGEASSDKDKYQDDTKESDDRRLSAKRHKDEEHREDGLKETRQRDEKHREDGERDRKNRDTKHRGETERHTKHRDDKHREDKYTEDSHRDKYKDDKYVEIVDRDEKGRDGKRKQDDEREYSRHKDDKHRDVKHRDDEREKRSRDSKYKDSSKDHSIEPEPKRMKDDSVYDDRVSRYKDDKDRRRGNDKEEGSEYRSRKSESEKRSGTKVDSGSERGRIGSRYVDVEVTGGHSRRRSSPSRDHHRVSKQEENKHRDSGYKLSSRSTEKVKDDVDRSPSSRRSGDVEEPGQRSGGGSKDVKDHVKETHHHPDNNNEYSQVDGDNLSVSSPYTRSSSHFRTGSDSPFFGTTEDDRNKSNNNSNNRHRRINENNNMSRGQGNWKNIPSWPSPMPPGGYMPFQHVPPPMFHPLMQQFPPPIFGRPPMKINPGLPYHVPDHGRPLQWREESGPPLHGWDGNNSVFGDEAHLYGGWDRRNQMGNRGWESSGSGGDMWKGPNVDVQSGSQKVSDEVWAAGQGVESEQIQNDVQTSALNGNALVTEAEKVAESVETFEGVDESVVSKVYLSRVDVSRDLTQDEVYDQCKSMMNLDLDQESVLSDKLDYKILFLEEGVEVDVSDGNSLFVGINDSVFEKAMNLYKKQKGESDSTTGGPITEVVVPPSDDMEGGGGEPSEEEKDETPVVEKVDTNDHVNQGMNMEVDDDDDVVVKQEEQPELTMEKTDGGLVACKVEDATTNDEGKGGGGGGGGGAVVLSDVGGESIEFNLSRIHHHSPESTH